MPENRGSHVIGQKKGDIPAQEEKEFALRLPFASVWALGGWGDARPHGGGGAADSALISCTNALTDTPRNHVYQLSGHRGDT